MNSFLQSANSRETSPEIMEAILVIAGSDESYDCSKAVRIWEDPTEEEIAAIWAAVTNYGEIDPHNFYWGEDENNWARARTPFVPLW